MEPGERLTSMLPIRDRSADGYLTMITRGGVIKRTPLADFTNINKNGIRAIRLAEGDELIFTAHTRGEDEILIATHEGYAVRFSEADGRSVGRAAAGVIAVRFRTDGDYVAGAAVITPEIKEGGSEWTLVTVTDKGYGKRSEISDYPLHNRGGMGVRCLGDENKGRLAGIATAKEEDDILIITDGGTVIRTPVSGISLYSRTAGGVRLMTLGEGQTIAGFTVYREKPQDDGDTDAVEVEIEPDEDIVKADTHMKMSEDDEEI